MSELILYAMLALGVSFLCSLLEASLLSLPRSRVESLAAQGSTAARNMKMLKDNIDRPLAAILTLNTIAHTVGAAGVGAQAAVTFGDAAVGVASAIMTLLILLVSEIIPKTLGAVHADRLVGFTAFATQAIIKMCIVIVIPLEWVNRLIGFQRHGNRITRLEVLATIRLGREGGALGEREHRIFTNLMALSEIRISKILTPRTVVFALPADQEIDEAASAQPPIRFSRVPIYRNSIEDVVGYVTRHDIAATAASGKGNRKLATLKRAPLILPEVASVADALGRMLEEHTQIALVVDEYGGLEGLVTLEDILETVLGQEIIDETDPAPDMQRLARRLADRRSSTDKAD